jgi:soluble lytic murein transglycosylase-like protein
MPAHRSVSRQVMAGCLAIGFASLSALALPEPALADDAVPTTTLPAAPKDTANAAVKNRAKPKIKSTAQSKTGGKTKIAREAKPLTGHAANPIALPLPAPDPSDMPLMQAPARPAHLPAQPSQAAARIPIPPARPPEIAGDAGRTGAGVAALPKTADSSSGDTLQTSPIPVLPLVPQLPQPAPEAALPPGAIAKTDVNALIVRNAGLYHVPETLLRRVVARESGYNPRLRNGPFFGLMQMRLETARGMGYRGSADGLLDADVNLTYGVAYLANAYKVAEGNQDHAVRLYSRGYYYEAKRKGLLPKLIKNAPSK